MTKDKKKAKAKKKGEAKAAAPAPEVSSTQRPADGELRFQNLIRNMVVARDQGRRSGG